MVMAGDPSFPPQFYPIGLCEGLVTGQLTSPGERDLCYVFHGLGTLAVSYSLEGVSKPSPHKKAGRLNLTF